MTMIMARSCKSLSLWRIESRFIFGNLDSLENNQPTQTFARFYEMAHPIEVGLVLEGEDAEEFIEDLRNPRATKEQIEMFKEAIKLYNEHPF